MLARSFCEIPGSSANYDGFILISGTWREPSFDIEAVDGEGRVYRRTNLTRDTSSSLFAERYFRAEGPSIHDTQKAIEACRDSLISTVNPETGRFDPSQGQNWSVHQSGSSLQLEWSRGPNRFGLNLTAADPLGESKGEDRQNGSRIPSLVRHLQQTCALMSLQCARLEASVRASEKSTLRLTSQLQDLNFERQKEQHELLANMLVVLNQKQKEMATLLEERNALEEENKWLRKAAKHQEQRHHDDDEDHEEDHEGDHEEHFRLFEQATQDEP